MIGKIITLAPEDDVAGARDRIDWAQTDRVVLVVPRASQAYSWREVDFALLRRASEQYGCEVAIVSPYWKQRRVAHDVGLVTFRNVEQAVRQHWLANEDVDPIQRMTPPRRFTLHTLRRFFPRRNWLLIGLRVLVA